MVLVGVELEVEKAGEIAPGASAAAPAPTSAKGHLDLAEGRFGPQKVLKRLLLVRNGLLPFSHLEFLGSRAHRFGGRGHLLLKRAELLVLSGQLPRLEPAVD